MEKIEVECSTNKVTFIQRLVFHREDRHCKTRHPHSRSLLRWDHELNHFHNCSCCELRCMTGLSSQFPESLPSIFSQILSLENRRLQQNYLTRMEAHETVTTPQIKTKNDLMKLSCADGEFAEAQAFVPNGKDFRSLQPHGSHHQTHQMDGLHKFRHCPVPQFVPFTKKQEHNKHITSK